MWFKYYLGYGNLLTAIGGIAIGFLVISKNWRDPVKRAFFIFTMAVSFYALFVFCMMRFSPNARFYDIFVTCMAIPVSFIAVGNMHFVFEWLGIAGNYRRFLSLSYVFAVLLSVTVPTTLFKSDPVPIDWGYVYKPGPVYAVYVFSYIAFWNIAFFALLKHYRRLGYIQKKQAMLFFIGNIIGALCGLPNFFSFMKVLPFTIPPLTSPFIILYVVINSYAIIRYRAMEIDTVIHKTILWALSILFLVAPVGIIYAFLKDAIFSLSPIAVGALVSATLLVFLWYYHRLKPRIDHFFRRRKYDYQMILGKVAEKISTTINIEELTKQLLNEVCEAMYLRNALLYIVDLSQNQCFLSGRRGYKQVDGQKQRSSVEIFSREEEEFSGAEGARLCGGLAQWISEHGRVLERGQLENEAEYEPIRSDALAWFVQQEVEVLVPLSLDNKVNAVLGLGKKENLKAYTAKDIELLEKLGNEAGVTVFNSLHYQELVEKERLDEEMRMGRQIQMMLLPQQSPHILGLTVEGMMEPAKEIGGDYYDFITLPNKDSLSIVIGDVSGKGVGAGLLMAMAKTAIHTLSQQETSPRQILLRANSILNQHIGGQKFMTMLYFTWHAHTRTLTYSSAGHEHILICHKQTGELEAIQSGGIMLGMMADIERFMDEGQIQMSPGDKILLYTDGVTEALDAGQGRFGLDRLKEVFKEHSALPVKDLMKVIKDEVYKFIGSAPQYDDITLVVLEAT
ncbi:MAG: SpoIIE family protein phosphatase [Candidatus Omnitrophota bacterium]